MINNKSVWIVYRLYRLHQPFGVQWGKKVMGVFETEDNAKTYQDHLTQKQDSKFGSCYQEWVLDDDEYHD